MGGITLIDIADRMATIISQDANLSTWCADHYAQAPRVQLGMDERDRPGPDHCPLILIRPGAVGLGEVMDFEIQIDWAVHDETVHLSGPVTEYVGVRRVDEMGNLIWDALQALPAVLQVNRSEYVLETVERFPLLLGGMDITITVPVMLSGTPLAI